MGSFIDSNITDGGTNQDFGQVVTQGGSTVVSFHVVIFFSFYTSCSAICIP